MAGVLQHLRSSTLNKRPNPASMVDGQLAINYASGSPGAFFKDTNGNLVKVGPVHVGTTAPNVSPASGGTAGNSLGEQWLDTSGGTYVFKIWDGAAWRSEAGEFVNSTGDTMTGSLTMGPSVNLIFEGSTDDGFETTLTVVDPTADRTITLPNVSGTVVTTGDSGTVTSTMIADGTIVNADVNASAAIAGTKISPDFGSQTIQTTGVFSHAVGSAGAPIITFTGDTNTGIYSPGADQLAISTGGSGRLFVDASGRVGIGASGPGFPLEVRATSSTGQVQILGSDNTNATWRLATPSSSVVAFGGATTHAVAFGGFDNTTQAFSERARIDSSGRLLVGTSSNRTGAALQVEGTTFGTSLGTITNNSANSAPAYFQLIKSRGTSVGSQALVSNGDGLGNVQFVGTDGTQQLVAAAIEGVVDGTPGANDMPGRLVFSTTADGASSPTERARITSGGYFKASDNATYVGSTSNYHEFNQSSTPRCVIVKASNASYAEGALTVDVTRAANSAYKMFEAYSGSFGDREYELRGDGNAFADGTWTGGGADYAEYFEWADSNTDEEDRRGISVVLDGDKIREAIAGEDPIGVISGNPSVVGDAAWNKWNGKYLRDEFGTYILDENGDRQLNPAYDPDQPYQSREERPEWDCVGLMGKLRIRKGQVTSSRWIKMRDINDSVEEWLVR
jgi:hypothetical protein